MAPSPRRPIAPSPAALAMSAPARPSWLAGTSVAVTRADGTLGRAVAASLSSRPLGLVLAGTDAAGLAHTASEVARIRALHRNEDAPLVVEADASTPEGVAVLRAATTETLGRLDALVHVAEVNDADVLAAATAAALAGASGGLLRRGGTLVLAVLAGPWGAASRTAALAATVESVGVLVRDAARRWRSRLAVNGVVLEAGPHADARALGFEPLAAPALIAAPQGRDFAEAARVVRFLASREAQALTGQVLTVGGGLAAAA